MCSITIVQVAVNSSVAVVSEVWWMNGVVLNETTFAKMKNKFLVQHQEQQDAFVHYTDFHCY